MFKCLVRRIQDLNEFLKQIKTQGRELSNTSQNAAFFAMSLLESAFHQPYFDPQLSPFSCKTSASPVMFPVLHLQSNEIKNQEFQLLEELKPRLKSISYEQNKSLKSILQQIVKSLQFQEDIEQSIKWYDVVTEKIEGRKPREVRKQYQQSDEESLYRARSVKSQLQDRIIRAQFERDQFQQLLKCAQARIMRMEKKMRHL